MAWVASAIVGGAVIGGIASNDASRHMANTATDAANLQYQQYLQTREDTAPWRQAGTNALGQIAANPNFTREFTPADLKAGLAPNYDWQLKTGTAAATNAANAAGFSGNAITGAQDWAQNYAGSAYQNAFNNWNAQQTNIFNRLSNIAGLGQTANQTTASTGAQLAGNMGNFMTGAAGAQAAGTVGVANAVTGGLGNYLGWQYLNKAPQTGGGYYASWDNPSGALGGP